MSAGSPWGSDRRPPGRGAPFLRFLLVAAAITGFIFLVRGVAPGAFGLDDDDWPRVIALVAILAFVASGLLGRGIRAGEVARGLVTWALIILVLVGLYANRDQLAGIAGRILGAIAPGVPISGPFSGEGDAASVSITRSGDGHFAVLASVEEKPMVLLVDTGASFVTLTYEAAGSIGVDTAALRYNVQINTANGAIRAASVVIGKLAVGAIERRNVPALVAPKGALDLSLLGLTFLNTLSGYAISGDRLVLTP